MGFMINMRENKNIIFLCADASAMGGAQRVTANVIRDFSGRADLRFTVISFFQREKQEFFPLPENVEVRYLLRNEASAEGFRFRRIFYMIRLILKVLFLSLPADSVCIGTYSQQTLCLLFLQKFLRPHKRYSVFAMEHFAYPNERPVLKVLRKLFYRFLDGVITLTGTDQKFFRTLNNNVYCIPNALPFDVVSGKNAEKTVISAGRCDPVKNYPLLLRVYSHLAPEFPDWQFLLFTDEPETLKCESPRNVKILPYTGNIRAEYQKASLYVCTSYFESFSMSICEAMACGTPAISFDCPFGPRDIITDGVDGFLVPSGDEELLIRKIRQYLSDPVMQRQFSIHALKNIQRFSPAEIHPLWHPVFRIPD